MKVLQWAMEKLDMGSNASKIAEFKTRVTELLKKDGLPPQTLPFGPNSELIPFEIEDLEEIRPLGNGGFGVVKSCKHVSTKRVFAVKYQAINFDGRYKDEEAREKRGKEEYLVRELKAIKSANSAFIPEYYGMFFKEDQIALCMELMDLNASQLYRHVAKIDGNASLFDERALGIIAISVLNALLDLKNKLEIMHRDIKPSNILVNSNGNVKLSDLGLVLFLDKSAAISNQGGTVPYYSPEMFWTKKKTKEYRVQYDVWSLGITLIEIARFSYPYKFEDKSELPFMICYHPAPALTEQDGYSEETREFINSCLTKEEENSEVIKRPHISDLAESRLAQNYSENMEANRVYMENFVTKIFVK